MDSESAATAEWLELFRVTLGFGEDIIQQGVTLIVAKPEVLQLLRSCFLFVAS
jgi:hypothetical protein